jgi:hypothetical protein
MTCHIRFGFRPISYGPILEGPVRPEGRREGLGREKEEGENKEDGGKGKEKEKEAGSLPVLVDSIKAATPTPRKDGGNGRRHACSRDELQLVFEIFVHKFEISLAPVHPVGQHSKHVFSEANRVNGKLGYDRTYHVLS